MLQKTIGQFGVGGNIVCPLKGQHHPAVVLNDT
jgi:hypothetical protein